jgi:anthranilate phosphoribosyltransferase
LGKGRTEFTLPILKIEEVSVIFRFFIEGQNTHTEKGWFGMEFTTIMDLLLAGESLTEEQAGDAISAIMQGALSNEKIAALLTAFHCKGETVTEVVGAAKAMRSHAVKMSTAQTGLVDTCGTGGDRSGTINISTATVFIVAGAGIPVAKHGNRSASSQCGSIDLLEQLGVNVMLEPEKVALCLDEMGVGILFARTVHPAMRFAGPVRSELGFRTIFNFLGPLTNPLSPDFQLVGVSNPAVQEMYASSLQRLGIRRAWVVCGDGLDEITLTGSTTIYDVNHESITRFEIRPEDVGLVPCTKDDLRGGSPEENAAITRSILTGELTGPKTDAVLFNAAAAIHIAGKSASLKEGIAIAQESLFSGKAHEKLAALVKFTTL